MNNLVVWFLSAVLFFTGGVVTGVYCPAVSKAVKGEAAGCCNEVCPCCPCDKPCPCPKACR